MANSAGTLIPKEPVQALLHVVFTDPVLLDAYVADVITLLAAPVGGGGQPWGTLLGVGLANVVVHAMVANINFTWSSVGHLTQVVGVRGINTTLFDPMAWICDEDALLLLRWLMWKLVRAVVGAGAAGLATPLLWAGHQLSELGGGHPASTLAAETLIVNILAAAAVHGGDLFVSFTHGAMPRFPLDQLVCARSPVPKMMSQQRL